MQNATQIKIQRVRLLFFIPTYNDQLGLPELAQELLHCYADSSVLVIDDGSTPPIVLPKIHSFDDSRISILRLPSNGGLGLSTSIAIDFMLQEHFDCLLRLDADGQHPRGEIDGLKEKISSNLADVVWGERVNHKRMSSPKALMGTNTKTLTAWFGQVIFGSQVKDWYTGFFAINRAAALSLKSAHLERYCEVQLLCILHAAKLRIAVHPIEQLDRQHGESSISWFGGMMIMLRSALMMLLYALRMHPK